MARDTTLAEVEINVEQRRSGEPAVPLPPPPSQHRRPPYEYMVQPFGRWTPWLVTVIVVANVAVFIVTMYVNNCPASMGRIGPCVGRRLLGRFAFEPIKSNPLLGPSSNTLEKMGALDAIKVALQHQWWRLITCMWLHAGVVHIIANMLSLLLIGIRLEQEFGFVKIGLLYVISGFGGSLLSALFIQSAISVGASGAVFGLLGSMLSELITNWTIYENKIAALLTLVFIIAINLAFGILPHVDNFGHIGGFISGFFLGFVFLIRPQIGWIRQKNIPPGYHTSPVKHKHKMYQYILCIISVLFLIVCFTIGLIMLFRGVNANEHCSWCHYLSCLPTSRWSCKSSATSCLTSQSGNELLVSCQGDGRSQSFLLPNATDEQLRELCSQVCS